MFALLLAFSYICLPVSSFISFLVYRLIWILVCCLSFCTHVRPFAHYPASHVSRFFFYLFIYLFNRQVSLSVEIYHAIFIYLFLDLFICFFIYLSKNPSIYPSVRPFVLSFVHSFITLWLTICSLALEITFVNEFSGKKATAQTK